MFVNAINTANVVFSQNSVKKAKEVTNPIAAVSKEPKVSADAALKSYFLGGQAVAFKGFGCSTSDFAVKKLDDVPCCCCGDRMIRGEEIPNVVRSFTALKGEKLADKIVITSDNPRSEDPQVIITDIIAGLKSVNTENVVVEPDRGTAIALLKTIANNNDVVLIAGKGHENYQILKDKTIHFDEREVIHDILSKM